MEAHYSKRLYPIVLILLFAFLFILSNSALAVFIERERSEPPAEDTVLHGPAETASAEHKYVKGEVLVKFKEPADLKAVSSQNITQHIKFKYKAIERTHPIKPALAAKAYTKMSPLRKGLYRNYKIILSVSLVSSYVIW